MIDMNVKCDCCGNLVEDNIEVFCYKCYSDKNMQIHILEEELIKLRHQIQEMIITFKLPIYY